MSGTARQQQVNIGIDLNVWEWPGAAPAFVFLHGLASNARTWSQVAEYLAAHGHRVVAYDQRGHGLSGKPSSGYGFAECQEDLARLIDALHLERPIIAGQSWGGNVVLEFAAAHPGVSRGLAFVDGGFLDLRARSRATWEGTARELRPPALENMSLAEITARIRGEHPGWSARAVEDTLANLELLAEGTVRRRLPVEHHMAIVRALWEQDPRALYPQVHEPVLICAAEPAGLQACEQRHGEVQAACAALAVSRVEWFTHSDHDIHVHRPFELSVILRRELVRGLWSNVGLDVSPRRQAWSTTISTQEQSMSSRVKAVLDPSHDVLRYERRALDPIFQPKSVAVVGATESAGSVGRTILWNLISNPFGGTVYPVNPKRPSVLGIRAYPNLAGVPEKVDLAVIVTPAATVPGIIGECVDAGVGGAIVISAGFKEIGEKGVELERQILAQARRSHMRLIGPNCLGVMNTMSGLNATFASVMARPGKVGFISQSGALCTAVLDWSLRENVGFSAFVSIGSMLDVDWGDLIDYLGDDPRTESIVIYMESIGDARSFISSAREVSLNKPIIVIKPGRTEGAARAAASHTGSLTGSDEVLEAAFRRSGVLRVNSIADLFHMADVLAKQPRPKGPRLTIVTNAGGPGVIATDALITGGGELADLSSAATDALNLLLPPAWSHNNPIDILGDASPERYAKAVEIAVKDADSDGLLVVLTPQAMTNPTLTAERLTPFAQSTGKPVLASWMGGEDVEVGQTLLNRANIPTFEYPDTAARVFTYMWRYSYNLRGLYETPALQSDGEGEPIDHAAAERIVGAVHKSGRVILTEYESKQLLAAYGIPSVETRIASSEADAVKTAEAMGYPLVLKIYSKTITHKTDVGGVQLNLADADEVRRAYRAIEHAVKTRGSAAGSRDSSKDFLGVTVQPMVQSAGYELILGSSIDPQFGPVLLFGSGGQLVEVYKDRSLALPPLTTTLARRMMEQTRVYKALMGVRGRQPVDLDALSQLMVRFGQLVVEQRWIKEIDINPLMASPEGLVALDARVVLHDPQLSVEQLPKLAIRPYPSRYVQPWTAKDGTRLMIRPIRPEDEPAMVTFHEGLSDHSVYLRFLHPMMLSQRVRHERLARICFTDYDREMVLVAELQDPPNGKPVIVGAARVDKIHGADEGQFSTLISDSFQGRGLGREMMCRSLQIARDEKLAQVTSVFTEDNHIMQRMFQRMGFTVMPADEKGHVTAHLKL